MQPSAGPTLEEAAGKLKCQNVNWLRVTVPRFSHRWTFPKMRTMSFHEVESMVSLLGALAFHVCRRMKMTLLVGITDSRIRFGVFFPSPVASSQMGKYSICIYLFTFVMWSGKLT